MTDGFDVVVTEPARRTVTIDRPKANAIDAATSRVDGQRVRRVRRRSGRCESIIVTGAGDRFFCAGWDLGAAGDGEEFDGDYGVGGFGGFPICRTHKPRDRSGQRHGGRRRLRDRDGGRPDRRRRPRSVLPPRSGPRHAARRRQRAACRGCCRPHRPRTAAHRPQDGRRRSSAVGSGESGGCRRGSRSARRGELAGADRVCLAPLSVAALLDIERRTLALDRASAMAALRGLESYRLAIDSEDAAEGTAAFAENRAPVWQGR